MLATPIIVDTVGSRRDGVVEEVWRRVRARPVPDHQRRTLRWGRGIGEADMTRFVPVCSTRIFVGFAQPGRIGLCHKAETVATGTPSSCDAAPPIITDGPPERRGRGCHPHGPVLVDHWFSRRRRRRRSRFSSARRRECSIRGRSAAYSSERWPIPRTLHRPSSTQDVEHADLFGQPDRIIERKDNCGDDDANVGSTAAMAAARNSGVGR